MNRYREMKERQQEEFSRFPMQYAFSDGQFIKAMEALGLTPEDTDKVYKCPGGGLYRREDSQRLRAMIDRFDRELQEAIEADQTGEGFIYEMFCAELIDHEYGYTEDPEDALDACGYTWSQVQEDSRLRRGFDKAAGKILGRL